MSVDSSFTPPTNDIIITSFSEGGKQVFYGCKIWL